MNRRKFLGGMFAAGSVCCAQEPESEALTADSVAPRTARLSVQSRSLDLPADLRAAAARGGGTVTVNEGVIDVQSTLIVDVGVNLCLGRGATLRAVTNTNVLSVGMGGRLEGGGTIDTTDTPGFSGAAIFLRGTPQWRTASHHTVIGDLRIVGSYQQGGTGIHLIAEGPGSSVCWVKFHGIDIQRMHTGVKLEAINSDTEGVAYINGNRFDVDLAGVVYGYRLIAKDPVRERTNGNWFRSHVQTTPQTERVVLGDGRFNEFDLMIWDWNDKRAGHPVAIEFGQNAQENSVRARTLSAAAIADRGKANVASLRLPPSERR